MDEFTVRAYETRAQTAWRWHIQARDFIGAANHLVEWYAPVMESRTEVGYEYPPVTFFVPIMVLLAIASENMLKGLLVAQGRVAVSDGSLIRGFGHHKQLNFATDAGMALSPDEEILLDRLRQFVESGKYPIGRKAGEGHGAQQFVYPDDLDATWNWLQRLEDALFAQAGAPLSPVDIRRLGRGPKPSSVGE